jgi:dienelactone hydrolase
MRTVLKSAALAALLTITVAHHARAQVQASSRFEMTPVASNTVTDRQMLRGDPNGPAVMLAGELRLPPGPPGRGKVPAVILVHGSGGINASHDGWARDLNSIGVAAFILDSFAGRGIVSTVDDQSQLGSMAMMVDAYRALALLAKHPRIDASRIGVMGFSKGAMGAVYSGAHRFKSAFGPADASFAAHIGLYTPCDAAYRDLEKTTGAPIRLFHGIADDYVSIEPCRRFVARMKAAGQDVTLTEFPDAYHGYDSFFRPEPIKLPQAQTIRACTLAEGDDGVIINTKTAQPLTWSDPCIERGTTIGYNKAAHEGTVRGVKEFLIQAFKLKE